MLDPAGLIDLDRYPVLDPEGTGTTVIERHARELRETGVSILPGFLRADVLPTMVDECDSLAATSYLQDVQGTPYLELPDTAAWPAGHPRVTWDRSAVHTVAYDEFDGRSSRLRALFEWDPLLDFVGRILGRAPLHRYADPLGAMNLAVMVDGDQLGWHFDQTDFVVSIALQSSEGGGEFENVQRLRWSDAGDGSIDERYATVTEVLAGRARERVTTVPMTPGTLMLFEGRWSLHRVTTVSGPTPRYVGLFGYDTKPGTMSSELLKLVRYGRVDAKGGGVMELGESFVGAGVNATHVNTVLGPRDGPVGAAWAAALATPSAGHAPFVVVLQPGLPVRPFTLFVNKATIDGAGHARLTWGAAQAGVAAGVADTVASGVIDEATAEDLVLIAAVWVDPNADDASAVFANNREATRGSLVVGRANLPAARDAASKRNEPWNSFYGTPPQPDPAPEPEAGPEAKPG